MTHWLQGKRRGLAVFLVIAGLVAGGLGWVTAAVLRLEAEQAQDRAQFEMDAKLRLAMGRLDGRVVPAIAREESRPYNHYSAISVPLVSLSKDGKPLQAGTVLEPSPLLGADLPDWMLLHFQFDEEAGWASPQVLTKKLRLHLSDKKVGASLANVTAQREQLLAELEKPSSGSGDLIADVRQHGEKSSVSDATLLLQNNPDNNNDATSQQQQLANQGTFNNPRSRGQSDSGYRIDQKQRVLKEGTNSVQMNDRDVTTDNLFHNGANWLLPQSTKRTKSVQVDVRLGSFVTLWKTTAGNTDRLLLVRLVHVDTREICQGIVLDWPHLQDLLTAEVSDIFPEASMLPVREEVPANPERTMAALPVQLDPGPMDFQANEAGWTPLRVGLILSWTAALAALMAVGLGGWSLLDFSERRIRFVSAVTHELRTPLTTLRLYLDMLTGGMVKEEQKKAEYLHTLHAETDRLNRLVANVLDFSRLENQRPQLHKSVQRVDLLLEGIRATWFGRCQDAGKELIVENQVDGTAQIVTDKELFQQILGNLIDNACKYSRSAEDRSIWLRARAADDGQLVFEVEDRGPGVTKRERRSIFRPFLRGKHADVTAGGVGLGLALANRWAGLLGGRLSVGSGRQGVGACFRLKVPLAVE